MPTALLPVPPSPARTEPLHGPDRGPPDGTRSSPTIFPTLSHVGGGARGQYNVLPQISLTLSPTRGTLWSLTPSVPTIATPSEMTHGGERTVPGNPTLPLTHQLVGRHVQMKFGARWFHDVVTDHDVSATNLIGTWSSMTGMSVTSTSPNSCASFSPTLFPPFFYLNPTILSSTLLQSPISCPH